MPRSNKHNTKEARDKPGRRQRDEVKTILRVRQGYTWQANTKQPHIKALTLGRRQNQRAESPSIKYSALTTNETSHPHADVYLYQMVCHIPRSKLT